MNRSSRRSTASTIVPNLLDAVERLCADTSPEKVGMRDIAAEAGLSVGVTYRYYESKTELLGAALERMGERLATAVTAGDDTNGAITSLWGALKDNPAFSRIVTWAILDGQNPAAMMTKHPVARDVSRAAVESGASNPHMIAAMTLLVGIGAAVYGQTIDQAAQRDPNDQELYDTAAIMLATWVTSQHTRPPSE